MIIDKKIRASFLLYAILVIILTRIAGDVILFLIHQFSPSTPTLWKGFTAISLTVALFLYFFREGFTAKKTVQTDFAGEFMRDLKFVLLFIFILQFSKLLIIENPQRIDRNLFALIFSDLQSIFSIFVSVYYYWFFNKWQRIHRHIRTRVYMKIINICLVILILLFPLFDHSVISVTGQRVPEEFQEIIRVATFVTLIAMLYFVLLISRKNEWIAILPKKKKLNFLLLLLFTFIMFIVFDITHDSKDELYRTLYYFSPFSARFIYINVFILTVFFLRLILTTLGSLPTAEIVEHQTQEIQSLTYLSKVLAVNRDINTIVESVTEMALRASGGSAAWLEKYNGEEKPELISLKFISESFVRELHEKYKLDGVLRELKEPLLVESIPEEKDSVGESGEYSFFAKSMIAVPIFAGGQRYGTLVVFHPEEYGFNIERLKVLSSFNDNIAIAIENTRLISDSIEKEKYKKELKLARDMQMKLLPQELPEIENYDIAAYTKPAEEVGGDFYDMGQLKNGKYCILIGDVSGKGISAAFYMAQLKGIVLAVAKESESGRDLLVRLNDTLYGNMDKRMYITLSAIVIEDRAGSLTLARAGHLPGLMVGGGKCELIKPPGLGLGLKENGFFSKYISEQKFSLAENEALVLITDGVNEVRNETGDELGLNNLKLFLENQVYITSKEYIGGINEYVTKYMGNNIQHDDITIISLVYKGEVQ